MPWCRNLSTSLERQRRVAIANEAVAPWLPKGHTVRMIDTLSLNERVQIIESIFERFGKEDYFGEPVTHLEHALQCAALADAAGHDDEVIIAALLHDIGHICAPKDAQHMDTDGGPDVGVVDHEFIGGDFLKLLGFSDRVTTLVESHVPAKRYLVSTDEKYHNGLADDSRRSLEFQGGLMTKKEVEEFSADVELRDLKLEFRSWDEKGKVPGASTPSLGYFIPMVERHLKSRQASW